MRRDLEEKPKLTVLKSIREKGYLSRCSQIGGKNQCRTMVMIKGGAPCMPDYKLNLEGEEAWLVK